MLRRRYPHPHRVGAGPLPRPFWRAWTVVVVARSAQFAEPFLPLLLLTVLGAPPGHVAAVLLAQQAAAVAGFVALGHATARLGVVSVVRVGLAGSALSAATLAAAQHTATSAMAAVGFGFSAALWRGAAQALVSLGLATAAPTAGGGPQLRARAFGLVVLASNAGAVVSAAAGAAGLPIRPMLWVQAMALAAGLLVTIRLPAISRGRPTRPRMPAPPPGATGGRARLRFWLIVTAMAPATALMFQAFSGLAVVLSDPRYRVMVLVNAAVLVLGQPLVAWLARRTTPAALLAAATTALGAGIALHAEFPGMAPLTTLWTLGELAVIVIPAAVVSGLAPHARQGAYVGWFQAAQGVVAAAATYTGPLLAAASPTGFAVGAIATAIAGAAAIMAVRPWLGAALRQPVNCPCGALLCGCDGAHQSCATPTPVLVHTATRAHR